jgi:hypothetical protein
MFKKEDIMLRWMLLASGFTFITVGLCCVLAIMLGTSHSTPAALQGFVGCTMPCWYGIPVKEIYREREHLIDIMSTAGYQYQGTGGSRYRVSYFFAAPERCDLEVLIDTLQELSILYLRRCPNLRLGDLAIFTGEPYYVALEGTRMVFGFGDWRERDTQQYMFITLKTSNWVSWLTLVEEIQMNDLTGGFGYRMAPWVGMLPRWYYCQGLQPPC